MSIGREDSSLLPSVSGFDECTSGDVGVFSTKLDEWWRGGSRDGGNVVCSAGGMRLAGNAGTVGGVCCAFRPLSFANIPWCSADGCESAVSRGALVGV
jgi:hypothetical protein